MMALFGSLLKKFRYSCNGFMELLVYKIYCFWMVRCVATCPTRASAVPQFCVANKLDSAWLFLSLLLDRINPQFLSDACYITRSSETTLVYCCYDLCPTVVPRRILCGALSHTHWPAHTHRRREHRFFTLACNRGSKHRQTSRAFRGRMDNDSKPQVQR